MAGNWKMNKNLHEAVTLTEEIVSKLNLARIGDTEVILAPPSIHLYRLGELVANKLQINLAGQNCHHEQSGAYTGEISAEMLRSAGAEFVILGHSERRAYFGEDDALISKKISRALDNNLRPVYCCGEQLEQRKAGKHIDVVKAQLSGSVFQFEEEAVSKMVIAYEPVWAIGTGETASPEQAQEIHAAIRSMLAEKYNPALADSISILYGGSCKPGNAASLFAQEDIDGGLIGGASLKSQDFLDIIAALAGPVSDPVS